MHLPTWEEMNSDPRQLDVLEYPLDQSLFVVGPPGSGKTVLAIWRARQVAEFEARHNQEMSSVAIVTFNRMLRRLMALMSEGGVEISTMHHYVWHDYRRRVGEEPPGHPHDSYIHDWNQIVACLEEAQACPEMAHMVVDEGQDLPQEFFTYVCRFVSRTMTVFADEEQALRHPHTTLENIKAAAGLEDPFILQNNHRNVPEIARLAKHFHDGRLPVTSVLRESPGSAELPRLIRSETLEATADLISRWYETRSGSIGVIVAQNGTGRTLHRHLANRLPERRVDIYENQRKNENSIDVTAPGVTVLNKESVKGQEFDTVFILEIERFIPCENDTDRRAMYMMCSRARDYLFLVHGPKDLTATAEAALPGPDVLERK